MLQVMLAPPALTDPPLAGAASGQHVATMAEQSRVTKERKETATGGYDLSAIPIVDPERTVPANFSESVYDAYLRMPTACLPTGPSTGKFNYTIHDATGSVIEVQLQNKIFYIKKKSGKVKFTKEDGSPGVPWRESASIDAAWLLTLERLGGGWVPVRP